MWGIRERIGKLWGRLAAVWLRRQMAENTFLVLIPVMGVLAGLAAGGPGA
jgi:hypothetical protein